MEYWMEELMDHLNATTWANYCDWPIKSSHLLLLTLLESHAREFSNAKWFLSSSCNHAHIVSLIPSAFGFSNFEQIKFSHT
jgi:hypothetical protein